MEKVASGVLSTLQYVPSRYQIMKFLLTWPSCRPIKQSESPQKFHWPTMRTTSLLQSLCCRSWTSLAADGWCILHQPPFTEPLLPSLSPKLHAYKQIAPMEKPKLWPRLSSTTCAMVRITTVFFHLFDLIYSGQEMACYFVTLLQVSFSTWNQTTRY